MIDEVAYDGKLINLMKLVIGIIIGVVSIIRIIRIEVVIMLITFIWSCTKVFGS